MFTGIIECIATVSDVVQDGSNIHFFLESLVSSELKVDQSVAHNGVCLTVVDVAGQVHKVTAVAETLVKTNLGTWCKGYEINIERSLKIGDRLDGHFVQGHIDCTAECVGRSVLDGSWLFRFRYPQQFAALLIEKGSVCINGVSLTVFNVTNDEFTVTIIPYTYNHTNFHTIEEGCLVNVEFDVLGKYMIRNLDLTLNP
jgi:riboflavin synthase